MNRSHRWGARRLTAAVACAAALLGLAACGSSSSSSSSSSASATTVPGALAHPTEVTLILDFIPNAVHAGIYRAIAENYYKQYNINLKVIPPSETADTLKLIDAGKAQFGLADGIDVGTQIGEQRDAVAVMAIAQRPLGGPIALANENLKSAAELQGKTVGITGVPSDTATLNTAVKHAGGDPSKVHVVTIGFNGVQDLEAGKVAAFTGFWPADGVQLEVNGHPITVFKLDENGGPKYPGLVMFTTKTIAEKEPELVKAFVAATAKGYEDTVKEPVKSLEDLLQQNPTLQKKFTTASLNKYLPLFTEGGAVKFGTLRPANVEALAKWMAENKLVKTPFTAAQYGTNKFLPSGEG